MVNKKITPVFGKIARRIVIEIDDKNLQRVVSKDYMVASGTNPETMIMISLAEPRPTDTRMLVMSLIQTISIHCNAIFAMMQMGGTADAAEKDSTNNRVQ